MNRNLIWLLTVVLFASVHLAEAQLKGKPRIGVLTPAKRQWESVAFREGLRSLGYVEGSNILIDVRSAEGKLERLPQLAAALINSDVDVILSVNTPGARAAIEATKAVPIVMTAIGDPVGLGLVTSLARPGGNVTGLSNMSGDLAGKRLELLKEAVPAARRIAVMMHPDEPIVPIQVKDLYATAARIGVELEIIPLRHAHDLERAFQRALHWRAQGLLRLAGQATVIGPPTAQLALKHRMPSMLLLRQDVEAGALMSYFTDHQALFRRAATYVDKILKGSKPGELPIEQPSRFEFYVNLKTAKQIGLTIPPNVLARADKVIKRSIMTELDKDKTVTLEKLMVSTLAMVDAVTKLLIEKSVISESEFKEQSEPRIRRSCTTQSRTEALMTGLQALVVLQATTLPC